MSKSLEKRLKNWKVIGTFKTKGELKEKIIEELNLLGLSNRILEYYIDDFEEYIKFQEGEEYALNLRDYDYGLYKEIIKREKRYLKRIQDENLKRRQAQQSMNIDDYRIVQKQKQAEYLVEREMKRMAKMIGKKNLLSYKPKVYVLKDKEWKEKNCDGYVTRNNKMFLPEIIFKRIDFYDPYDIGLKKIIYKKDEYAVKTIRHELTHLFVKEQYKNKQIRNLESDASPIFLYYLAFFEGSFGSGYKVQSKYENKICEEVQGNMTYLGVRDKCNKLLANLELVFDELLPCMTFTVDAEETYVNPNTPWLNVGYDIESYDLEKFMELKNEWLEIMCETSRKLAEKKEKEELEVA